MTHHVTHPHERERLLRLAEEIELGNRKMIERTDDPITEIRARHEADRKDTRFERLDNQAHADRATLLRLLAARDAEIERLREALKMLVDEKCDYMRINHLGDPETQHTVKAARAAQTLKERKDG